MEICSISHEELKQKWKLLIENDPETYNRDFLRGRYQNRRLQEFLDYQQELSLETGEPFDPVESIQKFQEELKRFPDGDLSEADEIKLEFIREPGHEKWENVINGD